MNDATNIPISIGKAEDKDGLALEALTDDNWLFIKHYLETGDVQKAYTLAGYKGKDASAPYQVFKRLKAYIEEIGNMAVTSRLKLVADLNKVLQLPLSADKQTVTISEWLRVRKFAASITPEVQSAPKMSVLIVNRYADKGNGHAQADVANKDALDLSNKDVITVLPIAED